MQANKRIPGSGERMFIKSLNNVQAEAATFGDGPILILAGAGSGKTRVLTSRVAYLIKERGVPAREILAVTFTNKAASEMRSRLDTLLGGASRDLWLGTFHGIGLRILREQSAPGNSGISVYGQDEQIALIKEVLKELNLGDKAMTPKTIAWKISKAKNELLGPDDLLEGGGDFLAERLYKIFSLYQKRLREMNAFDFGDLIAEPVRLLRDNPDILKSYHRRIRHTLVDEYQDTNRAQYEFTGLLCSGTGNLFVVGDPDQSIYAWRGACIDNILRFQQDYPGASVFRLEQNYRCTKMILTAANSLIDRNARRLEKELWTENPEGPPVSYDEAADEREEARLVIKKIKTLREEDPGLQYGDMAVFYRTNAQSRVFEEELLREGMPYAVVGGVRFYERKEIRDAMSYLRVIVNPRDAISFTRIVNSPPRGIGKVTLERIITLAKERGLTLMEALRAADNEGLIKKKGAKGLLDAFAAFSADMGSLSLNELTLRLLEDAGYMHALTEDGSEEAFARMENIFEFVSAIKDFERAVEDATLQDFLDHVSLTSDVDSYDEEAGRVTLMTLHAAKGLEFNVVFIAGLEEGLFPHSRSIDDPEQLEEERRLCYVGMTRAKKRLFLSGAQSRNIFGESRYQIASRFIDEIESDAIELKVAQKAAASSTTPYYTEDDSHVVYDSDGWDEGLGWCVGMRVMHSSFGPGVIEGKSGGGEDVKLTVRFRSGKTRKLMVKYAGLVPMSQ
ncbi:MAG: ATP-dependent helicase [Thermodesulfobacteriota bacterium]